MGIMTMMETTIMIKAVIKHLLVMMMMMMMMMMSKSLRTWWR